MTLQSRDQHRVVVTGMGVISAIGNHLHDFWRTLTAGQSGIGQICSVDCSDLNFKYGAEVKNYISADYFDIRQLACLDRFSQFALIAATEAVSDACLSSGELANPETAVVTGSCLGGKMTEDDAYFNLYGCGGSRASPMTIPRAMTNAAASQIALLYGITGPVYTVSTACSSSTHAIGQAFWMIRQGIVSRALTGGSEAPFSKGQLKAWEGLRILSNDACRPFSKNRSGVILGEGGAMLVLESLSHAMERGARIHAEIAGFGMSADAVHLVNPDSSGQSRAILAALNDAGLQPVDIQYINAHGTGTLLNDRVESETIRTVFNTGSDALRVSSTKAAHGHLLGATGAIETVATVLAVKNNIVPPTLNFLDHDAECDIPLVANEAQIFDIDCALCPSFAFGGLNAVLVLKKYQSFS